MDLQYSEIPTAEEAAHMVDLLNTLSLFSRKTMLEWLPELLSELNMTNERMMVMFELHLQPEISLKKLAQSMMVAPSTMSVMINSLVEQGVVTRLPDAKDRRRVVLRLSEKGRRETEQTEEGLVKGFQKYLKGLTETDRRELAESAEKLLAVVKRIMNREEI